MDTLNVVSFILGAVAGGILLYLHIRRVNRAFHEAMDISTKEFAKILKQSLSGLQVTPMGVPAASVPVKKPAVAKFSKHVSSMLEKYDIVFDLGITSFIATGAVGGDWAKIIDEIVASLSQDHTDIPPDANTIILRSVKFSKEDGSTEYQFEAINNPYRKQVGET